MEFWLDQAQKWKDETGKKGLIGLSATKDVQDAILNDAKRVKPLMLLTFVIGITKKTVQLMHRKEA